MPSISPSPLKRPSIAERNSSNHSLSSPGRPSAHKASRPHIAGRGLYSKQLSHGKNLSKLGRNTSATNLVSDASRQHQRQRSGPTPPTSSPRPSPIKRNASHAVLPQNGLSQVNLRKNHSASALGRNVSHPVLKKSGLTPGLKSQKQQKPKKKTSTFELGDKSSDEGELVGEEEGEWEDSSASPELTRNNSVILSLPKLPTPGSTSPREKPPDSPSPNQRQAAFSSAPLANNTHQSAPNLATRADTASLSKPSGTTESPASPVLLQSNPRSSRAPPAMSSILAHATNNHLPRSNSSKSFTHITHADAALSKDALGNPSTQSTSGTHGSSSADGAVSHFLSNSTPGDHLGGENDSDYDSSSNFIPNYHPRPSSSPIKGRSNSKLLRSNVPSRTQQRLELQRRETMRSSTTAQSPPARLETGFGFGSSASLHSRSGSRGRRDRSAGAGGDVKTGKRDYEASVKQMDVVRRFRNPVLESLQRLKDFGILPAEAGVLPPRGTASTVTMAAAAKRPPSRRGLSNASGNGNLQMGGAVTNGISRSLEEKVPSPLASRTSSRGRGVGHVNFQRQGSHDDIGLSRSRGSYEEQEVEDRDDPDEEDPGVSPEEALLRRMWESREVYARG